MHGTSDLRKIPASREQGGVPGEQVRGRFFVSPCEGVGPSGLSASPSHRSPVGEVAPARYAPRAIAKGDMQTAQSVAYVDFFTAKLCLLFPVKHALRCSNAQPWDYVSGQTPIRHLTHIAALFSYACATAAATAIAVALLGSRNFALAALALIAAITGAAAFIWEVRRWLS